MIVKSKILIIDSGESTRNFMRFILINSGYRVSVAKTAAQAMELVDEQIFDVILIDIRLPDRDGLELIMEIRQINAFVDIPILAVTQFFNTDAQENEATAGITHWITQPVSPHKLIELITEISPEPEVFDDDMINNLIG